MSRAQRLLDLVQELRCRKRPVSAAVLAEKTGVSARTIYRDIAALQAHGASIEGEPGVGYVLRPGFLLPPIMFTEEELEALVLGSRWVVRRTDDRLAAAARNALAKIGAVLPKDLQRELDSIALFVGSARPASPAIDEALIREAIRTERKLDIAYRDGEGRSSRRVIWPFALGFFDDVRVLAAWCESRAAWRHFRTDRIASLASLPQRYPRRRQVLLKEWRADNGIDPD